MLDPLKHIDAALREERKSAGPTDQQVAFAEFLNGMGRWDLFGTLTFPPNQYEEIAQRKNGEYYENEKMKWCGGRRILKRIDRNTGIQSGGAPAISPGWSKEAAVREGVKFMRRNFRDARWALFCEGSKHRACAHLHPLIANCPKYNPETIEARWKEKHGRCDFEAIKEHLGLAHYLCKGFVVKDYGKQDSVEFAFSYNSKRALDDKTDRAYYHLRQHCFRIHRREGKSEHWSALTRGIWEGCNIDQVTTAAPAAT